MTKNREKSSTEEAKEPCPACGGSGQECAFFGVSRFLLTWSECPACCGTGVYLPDKEPEENSDQNNPED